ncbi:BPSS1187 family protein [Oleiharenicola sp. Vm1]|uniref:BPSS1187 family protein n=1 Tax=Oleiharenicola sp. Vm1 TaxID=3398393 RepID=UPI0039F48538
MKRISRCLIWLLVVSLAFGAEPRERESVDSVQVLKVRARDTDPAIRTADLPHYAYVDRDVLAGRTGAAADRHELLLWIPGTQPSGTSGEGPGGAGRFCELAARLGYHAIVLKYPNEQSASICRNDRDPQEFERFRMALIAGGKSKHLSVDRAESIESRLVHLLRHLAKSDPASDWAQFLTPEGAPKWEVLAVAGQSQGGGHAALIALHHRVARVICTGSPKDYSIAHDAPAAWLRLDSATPKERFFTFNHRQDHQGCSPEQQWENLRALGLDRFGPLVDVDREPPPYRHSRMLTTDYPGGKLTSSTAHTMVMNPRHTDVLTPVWSYLLTEPVSR